MNDDNDSRTQQGNLPEDIASMAEDDTSFTVPENTGADSRDTSDDDGSDWGEDSPGARGAGGNPVARLLGLMGYYNPATRKTAVMLVALAIGLVLVLLIGSLKDSAQSRDKQDPQTRSSVEQGIGEGEGGDNLENESMAAADVSMSRSSGPGAFAASMFANDSSYVEDAADPLGGLSVTPEPEQPAPAPVSHVEASAARRDNALRKVGLENTSADKEKETSGGTVADMVEKKYGISAEALEMNGLTPEQFAAMMNGFGEAPPEIDEVLRRITEGGSGESAAAENTIPVQAATVRRSSGMSNLDDSSVGMSGGLSSLDSDETFADTDDSHPIKVMFARDEKIRSGQRVSLRLLEDIVVEGTLLQANTHLNAICTVGERLSVTVSSIEINGKIYAVNFTGYDNDGGAGLYCPQTNANRSAEEGRRSAGSIISSALSSGISRGVAGQVASAGVSLTSGKGGSMVTLTSGYTFYLMKRKY